MWMEKLWKLPVCEFTDPRECLASIHQEPCVVILDIMMPDMDGVTVLKGIKESQPHVPVIMLWYAAHTAIWWTVLWQYAGLGQADAPGWKLAIWGITLLIAVAQVLWHYALIRTRARERCFRAFTQNHWIGFVVFVATVALIH